MTVREKNGSRAFVALMGAFVASVGIPACGDGDGAPEAKGRTGGEAGEAGQSGVSGSASGGTAGTASRGGRSGAGGEGQAGRDEPGGAPGTGGSGGNVAGSGGSGGPGGDGGDGGHGGDPGGGEGGSGPDSNCGDGIVEGREACDDRNSAPGDGCHYCIIEQGWTCNGSEPSVCKPTVVSIAAGRAHTCVALSTGDVVCWGARNPYGQIGHPAHDNDLGDDETPASVGPVNVGGPVRRVVAGNDTTCALLVSGALRCWGGNYFGQLGHAHTDTIGNDEDPASAGDIDVGGTVQDVTVGQWHVCALLTTGKVKCWGDGSNGSLGYANTETIGDNETPASVGEVDVGGTVQEITAGDTHTCALLTTGAVRCWGGYASYGELGYGNTNIIGDDETPASAANVEVGGIVRHITAGQAHTCALLATGAVRCWGQAPLGYGNTMHIGDNETPASAGDIDVGAAVQQIAAGGLVHTCALLTTGSVRCWGYGNEGRLGYGNTDTIGNDETPDSAGDIDVGGNVSLMAVGWDHVCAVVAGNHVRCWGRGENGRLGYGNTDNIGDTETPASAGDVEFFRQ